jgi:hypothetical protein
MLAVLRADIVELELEVELHLSELGSVETPYVLGDAERVTVAFQGAVVELALGKSFLGSGYFGSLPADPISGGEVTLTLERDSGASATIGSATPPAFTLAATPAQPSSEPVAVSWSPVADDEMRWVGRGCANGLHLDGPVPEDVGALTFPVGVLARPDDDCDVTLSFVRERRTEQHDAGFGAAYLTTTIARSTSFTLTAPR